MGGRRNRQGHQQKHSSHSEEQFVRRKGSPSPVFLQASINREAYLQVSLTISRLVKPRSMYSSLLDAFTTPSRFSGALDS